MQEVTLTSLHENLEKHYDVFIASASFEVRSLSITKNIFSKIEFGRKIILAETYNRDYIQIHLDKFKTDYDFEIVDTNSLNQLETVDNILVVINDVLHKNPNSSFLIDITTFTRQNLLILVRLLRNNLFKTKNSLVCLYAKASDYAVGLPEEEKWLSKGVMSVHSIFGYVGSMLPSKPYHLIILMGYDVERAVSLIEAYEPSKITIGIGSEESSLSKNHYELNKRRYNELLEEFPTAENFEFSCSSVESVDIILSQVKKYPNYNVVITPMNNKISTLFLASASFKDKNIQIAIATPLVYNYTGYSSPGTECFIIDANEFLLKDGVSDN
jgi:hypothetical protein